ncbi:hypothetical protein D3C87_1966880 [compost metagenome]
MVSHCQSQVLHVFTKDGILLSFLNWLFCIISFRQRTRWQNAIVLFNQAFHFGSFKVTYQNQDCVVRNIESVIEISQFFDIIIFDVLHVADHWPFVRMHLK